MFDIQSLLAQQPQQRGGLLGSGIVQGEWDWVSKMNPTLRRQDPFRFGSLPVSVLAMLMRKRRR